MPDDTMTIRRSTYRTLLIGVVVLMVGVSFVGGFLIGNMTGKVAQAPAQQFVPDTGDIGDAAPSRVAVSVDDDPRLGNANAPVTVIEFSDFQCPFCGRFFDQTLPQIKQDYVDTGKVLFVYRDFPLDSLHPEAAPAAQAAACANEQGKFWEYHDTIFQNQNLLSTAQYKAWAADLGLNTAQFNSCLDSNKYANEVSADFQDGVNAGVSGTPTIFIGSPERGYERIVGAQPYSVIKAAIDAELA